MTNDLVWLSGTWFVAASNAPQWTTENKEAATYTFTVSGEGNRQWLDEEIKYVENGEVFSVKGQDFPHELHTRIFTWKSSEPNDARELQWEVRLVDETGLWMLTWTKQTGHTPEHVHILSKEATLEDRTFDKILQLMKTDSVLQKHAASIKKLL